MAFPKWVFEVKGGGEWFSPLGMVKWNDSEGGMAFPKRVFEVKGGGDWFSPLRMVK
jgi:hypothetical protein